MSNFDASSLQRQLITKSFLDPLDANGKSNVDGVFGTVTQAALVKYQEATPGLTPTGQPDDPTMQSLGLAPKTPEVVKWSLPTFSVPALFSDYVLNWLTSKTVWASTVGGVAIVAVLNGFLSHLGIQLDDKATVAVSAVLLMLLNTIVVPLLHAVFNKSKVVAGKVALKSDA